MIIKQVEREPQPPWTARSAGPKPQTLGNRSWLVEVLMVKNGTGVPNEEGAWWVEAYEPRLQACEAASKVIAEECAEQWYAETDQSAGECEVYFKLTAWTGKAWTVGVTLEWHLKCSPHRPIKVGEKA